MQSSRHNAHTTSRTSTGVRRDPHCSRMLRSHSRHQEQESARLAAKFAQSRTKPVARAETARNSSEDTHAFAAPYSRSQHGGKRRRTFFSSSASPFTRISSHGIHTESGFASRSARFSENLHQISWDLKTKKIPKDPSYDDEFFSCP